MSSTNKKAQLDARLDDKDVARDLTGSLEQCKEELRDAYMSFKDLKDRCVIDLQKASNSESSEQQHPVYYFKPETFLLDEPEKQR